MSEKIKASIKSKAAVFEFEPLRLYSAVKPTGFEVFQFQDLLGGELHQCAKPEFASVQQCAPESAAVD